MIASLVFDFQKPRFDLWGIEATDVAQGGLLKEIKKMKRSIKECNNVYTQS